MREDFHFASASTWDSDSLGTQYDAVLLKFPNTEIWYMIRNSRQRNLMYTDTLYEVSSAVANPRRSRLAGLER